MTRAALLLLFVAAPAAAHPLPNLRFDRTVRVRLAADAVTVRYTLELNDWTMVLDGQNLVSPAEARGGQLGYARKYAEKKAPLIADDLRASLDGEPLEFKAGAVEVEPESDHLRLRLTLSAAWSPGPGRHRFALEDQTFDGRSGTVAVSFDPPGDGVFVGTVEDASALWGKAPLDLRPGDDVRLRRLSAAFDTAGPPPIPRETPGEPTPTVTVAGEPATGLGVLSERGLAGLFDTGFGLGVLLLLAFGFGAAHAFTPGHGKTLVAAYLVGERGTLRHAVVLGAVTTLAHTGSVILVAGILRGYYGETVPAKTTAALQVVGGLLVAAVGLWLFVQRVRGRADHVHLFQGKPAEPRPRFGWVRVVLLGIGGGIVPCWDAVLLLLVAISAGRLGAAVPLLLAFSAGLAAVLVSLGAAVVLAHRAGGGRFGESRWFRRLPVASAVVLVGLGVWFARDGTRALFAVSPP